jgi:hypothetical protein
MVFEVDVLVVVAAGGADQRSGRGRSTPKRRAHIIEGQQVPVQIADEAAVCAGGLFEQQQTADMHRVFSRFARQKRGVKRGDPGHQFTVPRVRVTGCGWAVARRAVAGPNSIFEVIDESFDRQGYLGSLRVQRRRR